MKICHQELTKVGNSYSFPKLSNLSPHVTKLLAFVSTETHIKLFFTGELEAQVAAVEESQAILKASTDSILGLQILMPVIDPRHLQQLENLINSYQGSSGNCTMVLDIGMVNIRVLIGPTRSGSNPTEPTTDMKL